MVGYRQLSASLNMAAHSSFDYKYVRGFGSVADFIASDEDQSSAVFRRFDKLAVRDLLYYQSELAELESEQERYDIEDAADVEDPDSESGLEQQIRGHAQDWKTFIGAGVKGSGNSTLSVSTTATVPDGSSQGIPKNSNTNNSSVSEKAVKRWRKRRDLAMKIRTVFKEYREALIQHSTLLSQQQPSKQTMKALSDDDHRTYNYPQMHSPLMTSQPDPATYPALTGASEHLYRRGMTSAHIRVSDLVALAPQPAPDPLTWFLGTYCPRLFRTRALPPLLPRHRRHEGGPVPSISHLERPEVTRFSMELLRVTNVLHHSHHSGRAAVSTNIRALQCRSVFGGAGSGADRALYAAIRVRGRYRLHDQCAQG